jgi:hypothetical protein
MLKRRLQKLENKKNPSQAPVFKVYLSDYETGEVTALTNGTPITYTREEFDLLMQEQRKAGAKVITAGIEDDI